MYTSRILLSIVVAALAIPPLPAQQGQPPEARAIGYGDTVNDSLTVADDSLQDGSRYHPYFFQGSSGDSITIFMSSRDFNAHVLLADSTEAVLDNDANGGGSCNAHITFVLPQTGFYVIYANGESRAELGRYQLTVTRGFQPPQAATPCRGFVQPEGLLALGDSVTSALGEDDRALADTSRFEIWMLTGTASGVTFTIDARSTDFDTRLLLVRGFDEVIAADDDGGAGCNARIAHTVTGQRPLRAVVMGRPTGSRGSYVLSVTQGRKAQVDQPPCTPPGGGPDDDGA